MVLICIGIVPNLDLIKDTDIKVGDTGNICVDEYMRSNLADIYAAGDCIEVKHMMTDETISIPLALLANRSGRIAGNTLISDILKEKPEQSFKGTLGTGCVKIGEWEIASTGLNEEQAEKNKFKFFSLTDENNSRAHYYPGNEKMYLKIIVEKKTNKLVGVQMFGKDGIVHRINTFVAAITAGMTVEQIYNMDTAYAPPFNTVYDPVINICGKAILKINE